MFELRKVEPKTKTHMAVRAKFYVQSVKESKDGSDQKTFDVELNAVTSGSDENKQFFKYTPSGNLRLFTVNEVAGSQFVVGGEYYIDLFRAEENPPSSTSK